MPSRLPTLLRHAVFALLSGLLLTIAVAWSIAAFLPQRSWQYTYCHSAIRSDGSYMASAHYETTGASRRVWQVHFLGANYPSVTMYSAIADAQFVDVISDGGPPDRWPQWGRFDAALTRMTDAVYSGEHASGWPFLSLWYEIGMPQRGSWQYDIDGGIPLQNDPMPASLRVMHKIHALPLRPIWPGLLTNTLLYATLSWLLFGAYCRARASLRLHRNHCPRCNYDLRGLTGCPECGWNHAPARPTTSL